MQILADVLGRTIAVSECKQSCALGAAMFASVVAGIHADVQTSQMAMGNKSFRNYFPNNINKQIYDNIYSKYLSLGYLQEESLY